jgi:hypothetical protein
MSDDAAIGEWMILAGLMGLLIIILIIGLKNG